MSNLPPGVTGNEWAIAGPSYERDLPRTCDQEDVTLLLVEPGTVDRLQVHIQSLREGADPATVANRLSVIASCVEKVVVPECPFDGEVTVWGGGGLLHWQCPVCGFEHEEEVE